MIEKIQLEQLNKKEVYRYLGSLEQMENKVLTALVEECEKQLHQVVQPRYVYRIGEISRNNPDTGEHKMSLCGFELEGHSVEEHLEGCTKAVMIAVTLSEGVDKLIRQANVQDVARAVVLDAMANVAIEQLCDSIEQMVAKEWRDWNFTWRFGVGYGDFPISSQKKFLQTLEAPKRIGLTVNDSHMLTPCKSVTCVIGMSQTPIPPGKRGCVICNMRDRCAFRASGNHCGGEA